MTSELTQQTPIKYFNYEQKKPSLIMSEEVGALAALSNKNEQSRAKEKKEGAIIQATEASKLEKI